MHQAEVRASLVDTFQFKGFPQPVLERALDKFLEVVGQVCAEFAGTNRISMGDSCALTFANAAQAMAAVDRLSGEWETFQRAESIRCPMNVIVHKGELYAFRSLLISRPQSGKGSRRAQGIGRERLGGPRPPQRHETGIFTTWAH
jgi:hypothetical protein